MQIQESIALIHMSYISKNSSFQRSLELLTVVVKGQRII